MNAFTTPEIAVFTLLHPAPDGEEECCNVCAAGETQADPSLSLASA